MKEDRIFLDDFVDFDTIGKGTPIKELLLGPLIGPDKASLTGGKPIASPFNAMTILGELNLIDKNIDAVSDDVPLDQVQDFVDSIENSLKSTDDKKSQHTQKSGSPTKGIGSFSTFLFAKMFLQRFGNKEQMLRKSVDKFPSTNTYTEPVVKGKIRDYLFIADDTGKEGKGHLSVDMVHDFYENRKSKRLFFHWDIDIHKYTVHKRDDSNFPRNPFPTLEGKITFPDFSLDPCNELSIWHRGLDHKLFAEGKDYQGNDNFTVRNIFVSIDGGRLHLLGRDHDWYETTEDSCIDLMFKGFPPATGLPPQTNYCLGRCAHPHLVNTCGD